jgi:hypothetical protein
MIFFTNAHCFDVFKTMFWRQHIHILVLVEQHQQMWCIDINVQVLFWKLAATLQEIFKEPWNLHSTSRCLGSIYKQLNCLSVMPGKVANKNVHHQNTKCLDVRCQIEPPKTIFWHGVRDVAAPALFGIGRSLQLEGSRHAGIDNQLNISWTISSKGGEWIY